MGWFNNTERESRRTIYVQFSSDKLTYTFGDFSQTKDRGYVKGQAKVKFNLDGKDYDISIYVYAFIGEFHEENKVDAFRRMLRTDRSVVVEAIKKDTIKGINSYFEENKEKSIEEMLKTQRPFSINIDMNIYESDIKK